MKYVKTMDLASLAISFIAISLSDYSFANSAANRDLTQLNPNAIRASAENSQYGETAVKAFDDNQYSKWLTFEPSGWISYQFNTQQIVTGYSITSANDASQRDPQDWQLQGSNDGVNWTDLDTRSNQNFSSRYEKKQYSFSNQAAFSFIRLNVTANNGANILQLAEIELFGGTVSPPPSNNLPLQDRQNLNRNDWKHYGPFNVSGTVKATTRGSGDADLYIGVGSRPDTQNYTCASTSPTATESCEAQGRNLYVSVYGWSQTSYQINIVEDNGSGDDDLWQKPVVDFIDMNPETDGSRLGKRILGNPASHMAQRCIDVAKILYTDPANSSRFRNLRFELRALDPWGNDFVAYKTGRDGSGEMTIAVSTRHLERLY